MEKSFKGKKVLVTGAGAGIGRCLTKRLHSLQAEVYALSRSKGGLESLEAECPGVKIIQQDVADWNGTREKILALPVLDCLVNNAGIGDQSMFLDVPEDELDKIFAVNVKPIVNIGQIVARKMIEAKKPGAIVNVSSQAGLVGMPRHTSYGASKAAMDQITRVMAAELGPHQIRTNSINPTVTLTPMGAEFWGKSPEKAAAMKSRIPLGKFAGESEPKSRI